MLLPDRIDVDVNEFYVGKTGADLLERRIAKIIAVADKHEIGAEIDARFNEPSVHHLRADIAHKTERREIARDIALGKGHDAPVVADASAHKTVALTLASRTVAADLEVIDDQQPYLAFKHYLTGLFLKNTSAQCCRYLFKEER